MKFKGFAIVAGVFAAAIILSGCGDSGTNTNNNPVFSNIAGIDTFYTSYEIAGKKDTVNFSFDYNSSKVSTINIEATLDSGVSWITIQSIAANSSNKATVQWALNTDTAGLNYFGVKSVFIRISNASSSSDLILSDTFKVIGLTPFILTSPKGGESYSVSDSINVIYSVNTDRISRVTVCFRPNDTTYDLRGLTDDNSAPQILISTQYTIKNLSRKFCLSGFTTDTLLTTAWLTLPMQIILKDYGSAGKMLASGDITITQ